MSFLRSISQELDPELKSKLEKLQTDIANLDLAEAEKAFAQQKGGRPSLATTPLITIPAVLKRLGNAAERDTEELQALAKVTLQAYKDKLAKIKEEATTKKSAAVAAIVAAQTQAEKVKLPGMQATVSSVAASSEESKESKGAIGSPLTLEEIDAVLKRRNNAQADSDPVGERALDVLNKLVEYKELLKPAKDPKGKKKALLTVVTREANTLVEGKVKDKDKLLALVERVKQAFFDYNRAIDEARGASVERWGLDETASLLKPKTKISFSSFASLFRSKDADKPEPSKDLALEIRKQYARNKDGDFFDGVIAALKNTRKLSS